MFVLKFLTCLLFIVAGRASVPENYILDVSKSCGEKTADGTYYSGTGANVTIKSDLHVRAKVHCANSKIVQINPINDTNTETTLKLCYTNDTTTCAVADDCYFNTPADGSNFYSVELEVYWGFDNGTLMNEYETYTISCIAEGNKTERMSNKAVEDDFVPLTGNLVGNLGGNYAEGSSLKLIDVLGKEITGALPMEKKVHLRIETTSSEYSGVVPYNCNAKSKDGNTIYPILQAGCGEGVIFPKSVGFTTKGQMSTSPFFKVFRLMEDGSDAGISYECSFVVCNNTCDGSSCSLRSKRSSETSEDGPEFNVWTSSFQLQNLEERTEDRMDQSERQLRDLKLDSRLNFVSMEIVGISIVALLSLLIAVYSCVRVQQKSLRQKVNSKVVSP